MSQLQEQVWLPPRYLADPFVIEYLDFAERMYRGQTTNEDWQAYYTTGLRRIIQYVKDRSPYYQSLLRDVNPTEITPSDLHKLPFTTKEDVRKQGEGILSMKLHEGIIYYETTGTTGSPLRTPRSWLEGFASNYHFSANMLHLVNRKFPNRKPVVGILGPTELHSLGDAIGDVFRNINVSHAKFWPYSPKVGFSRAVKVIGEIGVNVLFGTPAVILPMIREAARDPEQLDIMRRTVKLVLTLGEVTSPSMRANIAGMFDSAECIPGAYGGTELLVVSNTCGYNSMHLSKQNYLVEVLYPDSDHPVASGEIGELVLTYLIPGARPLIRYRTGDLVSMNHSICACGNPCETLTNHGRVSDIVQIGDRRLFASELEEMIMASVSGAFGYRMSISQENSEDVLYVELEPITSLDSPETVAAHVKCSVNRKLGVRVDVKIVDRLPAVVNTGGFLSWKSARVLDQRQQSDAERSAAEDLAERWLNGQTPEFGNA